MKHSAEQRKQMRAEANAIAKSLADSLNLPSPTCSRITRNRGFSYCQKQSFSVPARIFQAHPAFKLYYVLHEATHCFAMTPGHGPEFRRIEESLLEKRGLKIVRQPGSQGYAEELHSLAGDPLCNSIGQSLEFPIMSYEI